VYKREVTLNPAIDNTILINKLAYGEVNRIKRGRKDIGGKGINVSKILEQFGDDTIAIGFLGSHNKDEAINLIKKDKVDTEFIYLEDVTRTNNVIVDFERGITTNINEQGFTVTQKEKQAMNSLVQKYADRSEVMVFSGSVPMGYDLDVYKKYIEAVNNKTITVLDADDDLLIEGLKASPYMIKPNIHELENAYDMKIETDEAVVTIGKRIIKDHGVSIVLISMGGDGSILVTKDEAYKAEPIKVEVKNTVGAGDSMVGGFLHGLINQLSMKTCLAYGTICGTLAVMTEANQMIDVKMVEEMMEKLVVVEL
jgi:1-phosphofructokinase